MAGKAETPAVDLDAMTAQQLTTLIDAAKAKRESKLEEAKAALRAEMERRAAELGLSLDAVMQPPRRASDGGERGRKARKDSREKVAAKYRGPDGAEWSGRGRAEMARGAGGGGQELGRIQGLLRGPSLS